MPQLAMRRFVRYVNVTDGCWLWTGQTAGSGARYGYFRNEDMKKVPAHRWIWEHVNGPVPEGLELDHVAERGCISKLCVKLSHLEPVTHAENRRRARLTVCRSGKHDLTKPENQRWDTKGQRRGCKVCWLDAAELRKAGQ